MESIPCFPALSPALANSKWVCGGVEMTIRSRSSKEKNSASLCTHLTSGRAMLMCFASVADFGGDRCRRADRWKCGEASMKGI